MALRGSMELKVRISSANDLEDVSLGDGPLQPYVVVWVPPNPAISTGADLNGHTDPTWNETHHISLVNPDEFTTVVIELYHYNIPGDNNPIIGSACLRLMDIIDDVGFGQDSRLFLHLSSRSGRFRGTLDATFAVRDSTFRNPSAPYTDNSTQSRPTAPAYGHTWQPAAHQPTAPAYVYTSQPAAHQPTAPAYVYTSQPTVVVGHPPGTAGTADASRMRNNRHHHHHHQKLEMWTRLVVCAVALCLLLWVFLSCVDFRNVGTANAGRVEKNEEEERFLMIMGMGIGMIALELGTLALMELMTTWTTLPTMWPSELRRAGDSDDDDGSGSEDF